MKASKSSSQNPKAPPNDSFVQESPTLYRTNNRARPLSAMAPMDKMKIIRKGISKRYLEHFKKAAALDYDSLATALSVTRATLINKKGEETFSDPVGERILSLADLYSFGYEIFEDHDRFNQWMFTANQALGGKIPFDLIDNYYGREEIKNIIGRIAYGVYS